MLLQRLLNDALSGRRITKPPTTMWMAVMPDGCEYEIQRKKYRNCTTFKIVTPTTNCESSVLRDLKWFLTRDFPGVRFERRIKP